MGRFRKEAQNSMKKAVKDNIEKIKILDENTAHDVKHVLPKGKDREKFEKMIAEMGATSESNARARAWQDFTKSASEAAVVLARKALFPTA